MYCPRCGKELAEGNKMCFSCGEELEKTMEIKDVKEIPEKSETPLEDIKSIEMEKADMFNKNISSALTVNKADNINEYSGFRSNYNNVVTHKKRSNLTVPLVIILILLIISGVGIFILAGGINLITGVKAKKTIMIYMVGSDLESKHGAASLDIAEMLNSNYDMDNVNVLLYTGGAKSWQTPQISPEDNGLFLVTKDGISKLESYQRSKMGLSSTLTRFLNYAYTNYKAESYGLVFWDHGGGPIYGYGLDEFSKTDMLTISEIASGIKDSSFANTKFEFIGFDACLMSSIEVANAIKGFANYMISSEESEPGFGWDYTFLNTITPSSKGDDIGKNIVDSFEKYYKQILFNGITISLIDLTKVDQVEKEMDNLFDKIDSNLSTDFYYISRTRSNSKEFGRTSKGSYDLVDLYDFANKLPKTYESERESLKNAINDLVIYTKSDMTGAYGVSTYFPYTSKDKIEKSLLVYSTFGFAPNYLQFIRNYSKKLTGTKIDSWDVKDLRPISSKDGLLEVTLPENIINSYSRITYRIFEKSKSGNYIPRFQGSDCVVNGNKVSTTVARKGITATDKEGNIIYLMAFEAERGEEYTKYLIPGNIEESDETDPLKYKTIPVFVHFVVTLDNPKGKIEGVTLTEPDVDVAAKTLIDIRKLKEVQFMGTVEYKIFDAAGNYLSRWEPVTDGKIEMIEENLSDVLIEFKDLDISKEYYGVFEIQDSQGNSYSTKPVKINK